MDNLDGREKEFKKNEGLARKVMEILINDYSMKSLELSIDNQEYLDIIKWAIEDYSECGYHIADYETYYKILQCQYDRRRNHRLPGMN